MSVNFWPGWETTGGKQCFSLYMAVILTKQPERATSLLLYQFSIQVASMGDI